MDKSAALAAVATLAQEMRLDVLSFPLRRGVEVALSGAVGSAFGVRQTTMSTTLAILSRAGLMRGDREGRSVRYFADVDGLAGLLAFLMEDCCGGRPELCRPVIDEIACA